MKRRVIIGPPFRSEWKSGGVGYSSHSVQCIIVIRSCYLHNVLPSTKPAQNHQPTEWK